MDTKDNDQEEIIELAKRMQRYCNLLIEQCDSWLNPLTVDEIVAQKKSKRKDDRLHKIVLFIILTTLFLTTGYLAQAQDVDSLYAVFEQSRGEKRVRAANVISRRIYELGHIYDTADFTVRHHSDSITAGISASMALYKLDRGELAAAIAFNHQSLELYRQAGDSLKIIHRLINLYVNYSLTGQYEKALECLDEGLRIAQNIGDRPMIANILLCIGDTHLRAERFDSAEEYLKKGLEIYTQLNSVKRMISGNIGLYSACLQSGRPAEALRYAQTADSLCESGGNDYSRIECLNALATVYTHNKEWDAALDCLDKSFEICTRLERKISLCIVLQNYGEVYYTSGRSLEKAIGYFNRCLELSKETGRFDIQAETYNYLSEIHKEDNPAWAFAYLEKMIEVRDSLQKEATQEAISNFHVQYETAAKQLEIERQHGVIARQNMLRDGLFTGLGLLAVILGLLWYLLHLRSRRARELAEMNATKDRFFSIISHDLKGPAVSQREALQILLDNAESLDAASLKDYYRELLRSADGQVEMLYNLLNWAQVQTGRMPYHPLLFNLVAELHNDLTLMRSMAERKGVVLEVSMPGDALVMGDTNMLLTVIRNLTTNAIKFTPQGKTVTLTITPHILNDRHTVTVTDEGVGMTAELLQNLFRIDARRSHRGTAGEKGSGLGLIVCKELLEKHDSTLHVESEAGRGSRFWFIV
jgi:signal transduction histidine kinase